MTSDQLTSSIVSAIYRYSSHKASEKRPNNHIRLHGLSICIETPKGHRRRPDWPEMPADYGFIKKTEGADGDAVDVFIGPHRQSEMVYVIDQCCADGTFDEHKVMLGYTNYNKAVDAYKAAYTKGWKVGKVTAMTIEQFRNWLKDGNKKAEIKHQVSRYAFDMFDDSGKPRLRPSTLAGTGSYAPVPQTWATNTGSPHVMSHRSQMPQDATKHPWHMSIEEFAQHHAKNPQMINGGLNHEDASHAYQFIMKHFGPETYRVFKFTDPARKQHLYNIAHAMRTGQAVHPDAIAGYPRDIIPPAASGNEGKYSASSGLPSIPSNLTRLTHFFANPDLKKKFLSGEPFHYHKQGVISGSTDSFSNNDDVHNLLQTGKTGAFDRGSFGPHVLIMDVPHTEHRLHNSPQWASGELHNGHIAGVYDRESGQFHSNPAYGTAPQRTPSPKHQATQNRPGFNHQPQKPQNFNTPIPQPSEHQSFGSSDVFSAARQAIVDRYSGSTELRTNLTDEQHKGIGESFREDKANQHGYFVASISNVTNHGVHPEQMLTGDDQNMIMFHAGVLGHEGIGAHLYGDRHKESLEGLQPEMKAGQFNFRLASAMNKHGSAVKKIAGENRAAGAKVVAFKSPSGQRLILHPAVRQDRTSDWQLSHIGADGIPTGHSNPESFQHGLHQALGVYHHPYYNHHGFNIEWTDRDGTKAPYQLQAEIDRYAGSQQPGLFDDIPTGGSFDEKKHPRWNKGDKAHHGGQFAPKQSHQPNLFETHGHPDQQWLFPDEGAHDDMVLTPHEPAPESSATPASAPAQQAKPAQQLGLFGDLPAQKPNIPKIDVDDQPKAKQGSLFDTHGNSNQMDLFGDGVMPDELVYKPQNPSMGVPQKSGGLSGFMRGEKSQLPKPQAESVQSEIFDDDKHEQPLPNPLAAPEQPDHADHVLSIGEGPEHKASDEAFVKEINDPRTIGHLRKVASRMMSNRDDAEDLVSDTLLRATQNKSKYDPEKKFIPWIETILHNTFANSIRNKKAKKRGGENATQSLDAPMDSEGVSNLHDIVGSNAKIGKPDVSEDEREAFDVALPKLTDRHRRVVELALAGNNKREIAKELKVSEQMAGRIHNEALVMLKKLIAKSNYVLNALIERYRMEAHVEYYAMCYRVYRYSVFGKVDRYEAEDMESSAPQANKPESSGTGLRMHSGTSIADRPDSISSDHSLHLSSVAKNPATLHIAQKLAGAAKGLRALGNEAQAKFRSAEIGNLEETPYDHVDWDKVKGHLDEVNKLHKDSLAEGHNVANIANYNGVIPKWLVPKLASGRKFVDPSMLGSKWTKDSPQPSQAAKDPEHGFQTRWNSKWQPGNEHRGYGTADEAKQAAMGHAKKKPGFQFAIAQHPEGQWYVAHREIRKPAASQSTKQPKQVQGELVGKENHLKIFKDGKWKHATVTATNEGETGWRVKHVKVTDPETGMYEHVPFPMGSATGYGSYEQARDEVFSVLKKKYGNPTGPIGQSESRPQSKLLGSSSQPQPQSQPAPRPVSPAPQQQGPHDLERGFNKQVPDELKRRYDELKHRQNQVKNNFQEWNALDSQMSELGSRVETNQFDLSKPYDPNLKVHDLERIHGPLPEWIKSEHDRLNGEWTIGADQRSALKRKELMAKLSSLEDRIRRKDFGQSPSSMSQPQKPSPQTLFDKPQEQQPSERPKFQGNSRMFQAGTNRGTIGFENDLHRDLYDLGARMRNNMRRNNGFNPVEAKDTEALEQRIAAHPEIQRMLKSGAINQNELRNLATNTHEHAKAQMQGLKDGEHRNVKMAALGSMPRPPAESQPSASLPQSSPQQPSLVQPSQSQSLDDRILKHLEKNPNEDIYSLGKALGVPAAGYGQAWDSSELNKALRRLVDDGKIHSPQSQPGARGVPYFSLAEQQPQEEIAPQEQQPDRPYRGNPVDGFPTEDDRWAWEAEQEKLAEEEYNRSLKDPESPNYDPTKDPNHPSYDSIANAESSDQNQGQQSMDPPPGYSKDRFKNVTNAIRNMLQQRRIPHELSDADVHEIGHLAANFHAIENEQIARKKGLLESLVQENSERRAKEVRTRLLSAHTANKAAIAQNPNIPEDQKASLLAKAEEDYQKNLEKELKVAANKSQSAINLKLTRMREIARGDFDPVSAAKQSTLFSDWDRRAESLANQFPDVLHGSNSTPVEQRLWEILQEPHPKSIDLRNHEDILGQAINHFIDGLEERKAKENQQGESAKAFDTVPFSARNHAQILRYSTGVYARYCLAKSLEKFFNKAS